MTGLRVGNGQDWTFMHGRWTPTRPPWANGDVLEHPAQL